jgi:hypothetical protein
VFGQILNTEKLEIVQRLASDIRNSTRGGGGDGDEVWNGALKSWKEYDIVY